ncbi:hypothetical protein BDV10DRAFT_163728, partial [Aspergillus recurvatus]
MIQSLRGFRPYVCLAFSWGWLSKIKSTFCLLPAHSALSHWLHNNHKPSPACKRVTCRSYIFLSRSLGRSDPCPSNIVLF